MIYRRFYIGAVLLMSAIIFGSWGFWGHKTINQMAVYTLPSQMIGFYKDQIEYLTSHAVDADKRRYVKPEEAAKHYIDLDHYGNNPLKQVSHSWYAAVKQYGEDTLKKYGVLPWNIQLMLAKLTTAFRNKDGERILYLSANIGHYIADAHVPLHTTQNYDGQLTNQPGIHGLWESRIPELFGNSWVLLPGKAQYYEKPREEMWHIVGESYALIDSVLRIEKILSVQFPDNQKNTMEQRGGKTIKTYSAEYAGKYNRMLNNMAARRMKAAVLAVGSFWYTAWVNAGKPDLNALRKKKKLHYILENTSLDSTLKSRWHEE